MHIRHERPGDERPVEELIRLAFLSAEHTDGQEHELVRRLRQSSSYIPELTLVAERHADIVGFVMFTRAKVDGVDVLALAPLCVLPQYQRCGVGTALVNEGHRRARAMGFHYCVVLGSDAYYPKFGYLPAHRFGIRAPFEVPKTCFMAFPLHDSPPAVEGVMQYDPAFGIG